MSSLPILPASEEEAAATIQFTQKGKKMLVDEKSFEYIKKDEKAGVTYWICRKKKLLKCTAKASTVIKDNGDVVIKKQSVSISYTFDRNICIHILLILIEIKMITFFIQIEHIVLNIIHIIIYHMYNLHIFSIGLHVTFFQGEHNHSSDLLNKRGKNVELDVVTRTRKLIRKCEALL